MDGCVHVLGVRGGGKGGVMCACVYVGVFMCVCVPVYTSVCVCVCMSHVGDKMGVCDPVGKSTQQTHLWMCLSDSEIQIKGLKSGLFI